VPAPHPGFDAAVCKGATDALRAAMSPVDDPPRVRAIWLSHTGKPAVVRNAALRAAQGEYVALRDSDDLWLSSGTAAGVAQTSGSACLIDAYRRGRTAGGPVPTHRGLR
jgi:glycosyltransferase involved in cell wall biosynthesis